MNLPRGSHLPSGFMLLLLASTSSATGIAIVSIRTPGEATVMLTGPDGRKLSQTTSSGEAVLGPKTAGLYRISVTIGGRTTTGDVNIPAIGQARIIFDPRARVPIESYISEVAAVTVTAQSAEEAFQRTPAAITILDRRQLEMRQITNLQQASYSAPSLWLEKNEGTSSGAEAAIRGGGEDKSVLTSDSPVAIYIDDVYIPRQTGAQFDLYDVERLEILRGPQGSMYGRNSSAGALRLVTRQPGNKPEASLDAAFGSFSQTDLRGFVNAPVGEKGGVVFAGLLRKHDGYCTNTAMHARVNNQDVRGGRVAVRFLPTPALNIVVNANVVRDHSTPGYGVALTQQPPFLSSYPPFLEFASGFGVGETDVRQQMDGDRRIHTLESDLLDPRNHVNQAGYSATVSRVFGKGATLKSITAFGNMRSDLLLDADGRVGNAYGFAHFTDEAPAFHLYQLQTQRHFSQEFQFSGARERTRFLGGFYYLRNRHGQTTESAIFNPLGDNKYSVTDAPTTGRAAYASVTRGITSHLSITGGARLTLEEKDFLIRVFLPGGSQMVACADAQGALAPQGAGRPCNGETPAGFATTPVQRTLEKSWSALTPRFAADYVFEPNAMVYASYARGFKSGTFDGGANSAAAVLALQPTAPETVDSWEAGVKSDFAGGKARANATVFLSRWKDMQGTGVDFNGTFYRATLGDVVSEGAELEARIGPVRGFEFFGQGSLLSTRYDRITFDQEALCGSVATANRKLELKMSPPYSYQAGMLHATRVRSGRLVVSGVVSGKGRFWHTTCNADPGSEDGFRLVDAYIAFEGRDNRWRIAVTGQNITDEPYLIGSFTVPVLRVSSGYLNPPRRFALTLRYSFN